MQVHSRQKAKSDKLLVGGDLFFMEHLSRLVFIRETVKPSGGNGKGKQIKRKALYKCVCGKEVECPMWSVKCGRTKSCGCISKEFPANTKHGKYYHPLYKVFNSIKGRCYNKNNLSYNLYGGEGVTVCKDWLNNPQLFIDWALSNGWQKGMEIDKDIKGGKIYSPENCLVVSKLDNCNMRRNNHFLEYLEERLTMAQWARKTGINEDCISMRIKHGWSVEDTLTKKVKKIKNVKRS